MVRKHCHRLELTELDAAKHNQVAMNYQKGDQIYLCLRACPDCLDLTDQNRLFIVSLHELAHSCTKDFDPLVNGSTKHGETFKLYEGFLIYTAEKMNLLDTAAAIGSDYCGVRIPSITPVNK